MIIGIEPGKRVRGDVAAAGGEEKGFRIVGTRRDPPARDEAVGESGVLPDRDLVPDGASSQGRTPADPRTPQDAVDRLEPGRRFSGEDTQPLIELPATRRKRSGERERFERRAEEIARAAEIGVRAMMEEEAKLFPPLVEDRLPEIAQESRLAGGDARQETRGQDTDAGIEQRAWSVDPEGRDAIPFGLKRRVQIRIPVIRDQESRRAAGVAVPGGQGREVRIDGGIGIDDQEIAAGQKGGRVAQRARGAQNHGFLEKRELRKLRRLLAQVALDLVSEVMEINRHFADAGLLKAPQVGARERDVQKRE
ncbi:MAG TPA: hypothetical protein VIB08_11690 [Thermoanaerobaculia bacterium]